MNDRIDTAATPADDWLDLAMREDGREHRAAYLPDGGFTARVAAALPAPAALPAWRTPAVAVLWTMAGAGLALALPGTVADVAHQVTRILGAQPVSLANIATGVMALGLATWAAAAYALRRDD
jgi:hypothetical protein